MKTLTTLIVSLLVSLNIRSTAQTIQQIQIENNNFEMVWNEEFKKDGALSEEYFNFETGFVRNQELQWYQANNASCQNGKLVILAKRVAIENPNFVIDSKDWRKNRKQIHYTSACVTTKNKKTWPKGGYFEIKAKIDTSLGSWPAIWLLGNRGNWPNNGEIDLMEFYRIDKEPNILANAAWGSDKPYAPIWDSAKIPLSKFISENPDWPMQFHIWSMLWNDNELKIYLDHVLLNEIPLDKTVNANGVNPFLSDQEFYLLVNLAIGSNGGDPSNTKFPIAFEIDYIRVYKKLP